MEESEYLAGRIRELSNKAYQNEYVTHTEFLSASEIAAVYEIMARQGMPAGVNVCNGVSFCLYGGWEEADRNVLCFLPSYLDEEAFCLQGAADPQVVSCIRVRPVNARFADDLIHRDYLGALMNMGIERDQIGDILAVRGSEDAFIFVMKDIAKVICAELIRIRHTSVRCEEVLPGECNICPEFEEIEGSVASERLDAILAFVYRLSRAQAQQLIEAQDVFVDGRSAFSGGYDLKTGARVSVRGYGKFQYEGTGGTSKKGRLFAKVKLYK